MARYNYLSPGTAAGEGLLEVLTQRRDEERQRMLDEITKQNAEQNRKSAEQSRAATQQQIEESKQRSELATLGIQEEGLEPGDDIPVGQEKLFEKYGKVRPTRVIDTPGTPVPYQTPPFGEEDTVRGLAGPLDMGTVLGAPIFQKGGYAGTQAQRDRDRRTAKVKEIQGKLNPDLSTQEIQGLLLEAEAAGVNVDAGTWREATRKPRVHVSFDDFDGKYRDTGGNVLSEVPEDAIVTRRPRTPQGRSGPQPRLFTKKNPNGTQENRWIHPGQEIPSGFRQGNQLASEMSNDLVPQNILRQAAILMGAADEPGPKGDLAYSKWHALVSAFLAEVETADPTINQAVQDVLDGFYPFPDDWAISGPFPDPDNPPTAEELSEMYRGVEGVTEVEREQFHRLVKGLRGY